MKDNIKNLKILNEFTRDTLAEIREEGYDEWDQLTQEKQEHIIKRISVYLEKIKKEHNR